MIYSHFIGRVGAKDAQVVNGQKGSFMAVDVAVDTYSKGVEKTMWLRVRSNRPNHISLAKYLTRGKLLLIEGTLAEPTFGRTRTAGTMYNSPLMQIISIL